MERKHSDVLLAALIFVGTCYWLPALVVRFVALDDFVWIAIWFAGAVAGAQVARRALPRLGLADSVIAAPIAMAIALGVFAEISHRAISLRMLVPIGAAALGALAGSLSSRRRSENVARIWLVLAAGFASFGAAVIAGGVGFLLVQNVLLCAAIGATIGSLLVAVFTPTTGRQCALGLGVVAATAVTVGASSAPNPAASMVMAGVGGFVIGVIAGGIGGRIGDIFRREPDEEPQLPEAQIRRD